MEVMEQVPKDLKAALIASSKAHAQWKDLTPISRRDFIRWIESAKQEKTRERRVQVAISKLLSGERRPCCYAVVPMNLYKALGGNTKAKAAWKALSANEKRDLVAWVEDDADTSERVIKAIRSLASGKSIPR